MLQIMFYNRVLCPCAKDKKARITTKTGNKRQKQVLAFYYGPKGGGGNKEILI